MIMTVIFIKTIFSLTSMASNYQFDEEGKEKYSYGQEPSMVNNHDDNDLHHQFIILM